MIYIANDIESTGPKLGVHSMLSLGACLISREDLTYLEHNKRGYVFYAELKPESMLFEMSSMRVGCSHLVCLDKIRKEDVWYDPTHSDFQPRRVLEYMQNVCEEPSDALHRFLVWIQSLSCGREVVGVTNTVFFDSGHLNLFFNKCRSGVSPYGWGGLDLDSLYRGYARRSSAKLEELKVKDTRSKPHRADQDAVFLARIGKVLLFDLMKW